MSKKKLIILIAIIVIVIIAIIVGLTMYFSKRAKYVYDIEEVTHIEYNVINIDNKYGVIDGDGNIVIEPNYDVIQIPNPSKALFICMSNYNTETRQYETKVLNANKEQIITGYENVQAIATQTTADGIPYEKTVLKYLQNGKYGLLSVDGEEITEAIYDSISAVTYKEGMLLVQQDEKMGIININGVQVIDVEYDNIIVDNYYDVNTKYQRTGFIVCKTEENGYRYGYIDYKGDVILDTEYTEIARVTEIEDEKNIYLIAYKDGQAGLLKNNKIILDHEYEGISYNSYNDVFVIQRNGKQGVTNREGEIILDTKYTNISFGGIYVNVTEDEEEKVLDLNGNELSDGYISRVPTQDGEYSIVYGEDEVYKVIDNNGNVIIDKNYTYIEELDNNYFIVANYNNNGIVDLTGKSVIELKYSSIFKLNNTNLLQANISSTNTISLINSNMEIIVTMEGVSIEVADNYVRLYSETENRYFDYSGNEITAKEAFPENNLYAVEIDGKWGFEDRNGNLVVQNKYDMVTELNEYGFAGIKLDGKWGVINSNGEIILEPTYELTSVSPSFIGIYYKSEEWYGNDYYTTTTEEVEDEM